MDLDPTRPSLPRKVKFAPKRPPSRPQPKREVAASSDDVDEIRNQELLRQANDRLSRRSPKAEKKAPVQVAIAHGGAASSSLRSFGKQNYSLDSELGTLDLSSVGIYGDIDASSKKRDYREPWDYQDSYYPTTLPLRRPYSGDPELLDEEEFGADATEYDENAINSASDLGLQNESKERRMIFFQYPDNIRMSKQTPRRPNVEDVASSSKQARVVGSSVSGGTAKSSIGSGNLESSPSGLMGKMLVYKSGAVKLKIGDILYDVSPGSICDFPEDAVAINTAEKQFLALGEISKHAIVSPDLDFLLDPQPQMDSK